ncbi:MAG: hypothetical protein AAFP90_07375 [Planctomycetota bacterium]
MFDAHQSQLLNDQHDANDRIAAEAAAAASRRSFMATAASSLLGVTTFSTLASASAGQVAAAQSGPRRGAKHIIYLFMKHILTSIFTI